MQEGRKALPPVPSGSGGAGALGSKSVVEEEEPEDHSDPALKSTGK